MYHPADLFKLYVYGYLNGIRTSRLLERECQRNIELLWLLKGLATLLPDHCRLSVGKPETLPQCLYPLRPAIEP